jgi:hypothetical protein
MSLTILDIWQLLQVHDILNLPTLPNSIINNTRDEEICDKEDVNQKEKNHRQVQLTENFCDIFRHVCSQWICVVINCGVVVADKKGEITPSSVKSR